MIRSTIRHILSIAAIAAVSALAACGGSGGNEDPGVNDTAPTYTVTTIQSTPITHDFTQAGTYVLTVSGDFATTTDTGPVNVWFSFGGQGSIKSGDAEPAIPVTAAATHFQQQIAIELTGAGPWDVQILTNTMSAFGTMTNLTLNTEKR
jgi:hypothetical protein